MAKKNINDGTDAMDRRLQSMLRGKASQSEIHAATVVYERVRTARAICQSYLMDLSNPSAEPTEASVVALTVELGRVAALHSKQGPYSEE